MLGIEVIQDNKAPVVDLVFIHGLKGDSRGTWTISSPIGGSSSRFALFKKRPPIKTSKLGENTASESVFWPRDLLGPEIPEARILSYGYDADVSLFLSKTADNNIFSISQGLIVRLEAQREATQTSHVPIIFLCHSLGGIVVKDALKFSQDQMGFQDHLHSIFSQTYGVIFFGTPHRGSDFASLGRIVARIAGFGLAESDQALLQALEVGSPELQRIADSFIRMIPKEAKGLNVYSFQEGMPLSGVKFAGKVVEDYSSVIGDAYEGKAVIHADHMAMCRFSCKEDPDYCLVLSVIRRWVEQVKKAKVLLPYQTEVTASPANSEQAPLLRDRQTYSRASFLTQTSKIFNLPQVPVRHFTGRSDELRSLESTLKLQSVPGYEQRIVVLYGLGGIGKSQLALYYAYKHSSNYKAILWINSKNKTTVITSFQNIAQRLVDWAAEASGSTLNFTRIGHELGLSAFVTPTTGEVTVTPDQSERLVASVTGFLERPENAGWLMVFDAADDLDEVNLPIFFPKKPTGDIIVSSRNRQAAQLGIGLEISGLNDESAQMLLMEAGNVQETLDNQVACLTLAKTLENLPLALSQAASYMAVTPTSPSQFLRLYQTQSKEMLQQRPAKALWQYEETVFTTWEISFRKISQSSPAAARLLLVSGLFNSKNIPCNIFQLGSNLQPHRAEIWESLGGQSNSSLVRQLNKLRKPRGTEKRRLIRPIHWLSQITKDEHAFRTILSLLLDYSLISESSDQNYFSMHSLVSTWCRIRPDGNKISSAFDAVVLLGRAVAMDLNLPGSWPLIQSFFPLVLEICDLPMEYDFLQYAEAGQNLDLPHAMESFTKCMKHVGRTNQALRTNEYNYEWMCRLAGPLNPMSLFLCSQKATLLEEEGRTVEAEQIWHSVIRDSKKRLGKTSSDTFVYIGNLGANLLAQDKYAEAQKLLETNAWSRLTLFGIEDASPVFINLAVTYMETEDFEKANEALAMAKRGQLSVKDGDLTNMLHIMGWQSYSSSNCNDREEAEKILVSAVDLVESKYGFSSPLTLQWYNNLLQFWTEDPPNIDDALEEKMIITVDRVCKELSQILGHDDVRATRMQNSFGHFYWAALGKSDEGHALLQQAIECSNRQYALHPSAKIGELAAACLTEMGIFNWDRGMFDDAMVCYKQTLQYFGSHKESAQWKEIDELTVRNNIAVVLRDSGRLEEAKTAFEAIIERERSEYDSVRPLLTQNNLAHVLHLQGKHDEALTQYNTTYKAMQEHLTDENMSTLLLRHNVACLYESIDRLDKAVEILEEVFEGKQALIGLKCPATLKSAVVLQRFYRRQGRFEDAARLAERIRPFLQRA